MILCRIKTCAACALIGMVFANGTAAGPSFTGLGFLPGSTSFSAATNISADGSTVIGFGQSFGKTMSFRWTRDEGFHVLGELPGNFLESHAVSVDADGSTIVGHELSVASNGGAITRGYRWTFDEGIADLAIPSAGNPFVAAMGVSGDGSTIAGFRSTFDSSVAYRWSESDGSQDLGFLPSGMRSYAFAISDDASTIVGDADSSNGIEAFRWTEHDGMVGLGDLPGGSFSSSAADVSADGTVIVGTSLSDQGAEAFRWTATDGMIGLGDLPGGDESWPGGVDSSVAWAISDDGSIVLGASNGENGPESFLWTEQEGMRSLADVFANDYGLDFLGWELLEAHGISADNSIIVGTGINPNGDFEAFIARVPSPGTLTLFGLGGIAALRRRR